MPPDPLVSVVIVCWNSAKYLSHCLASLSSQTFSDFEVVFVDNGSTDEALDKVVKRYPHLRFQIKKLEKNLGFSVANNIGARLACGKWLVLLNTDAFPEPNWLENLLGAARKNPEYSFFTSRQVQANHPEFLDGAGDEYHVSGLAWRRYYNQQALAFGNQVEEVFSACAAASLYLRTDFLDIGGFDEDYFSYFEDVDLSFRLRLAGGRCLYTPEAIVHHVGSASLGRTSDFAVYHGHRNLEWTYFKNMPSLLFWLYMPLHMIMSLFFVLYFSLHGKWDTIFKAKRDALYGITKMFRKRKIVQKNRTASMLKIYQTMSKGLLAPYQASLHRQDLDKNNE